jgi:hypothetical protein
MSWRATAGFLLTLFGMPLLAQGPAAVPMSQRVVAYSIEARLNARDKTIDATEVLAWRNLTGRPQDTFPFHLYLNAFQPKSTFQGEIRRDNPTYQWKDENAGAIEIRKFEVDGAGDLTQQLQFIHPDDDNADDRTVAQIKLQRPIPPGGTATFRITFHDKLPIVQQRTGYRRDFFMVAQWFPKVGVWWKGAWNCHQFHAMTEFFADFGTYDVKLTVPRDFVLGSSGDQVASVVHGDTKTVTYHAEDIHDFAWTADPNFRLIEDTWTGSTGRPVRIHLLLQPGHLSQARTHLDALKGTLALFDHWYGPYPYDRITVVDPAHGAEGAGGMEYPTLITAGTSWLMPRGIRAVEGVVEHEFGHQYWYGMVATNEFEEAWLDEGINTYVESKVLTALYGSNSVADFHGLTAGPEGLRRLAYINIADDDPLSRFSFRAMTSRASGGTSYSKTSLMLSTLEGLIGDETLRRALRTWFERYRFQHPTGYDFVRTVEEVSGRDLKWFFDQAVYGTQVLDYEVLSVQSDPVNWFEKTPPKDKDKKDGTLYRSNVLVHRKGDFIFPVEIEVRFDDGEKIREHWDGRDRWVRFTYQKKAKLVSAEVDPDHKVPLDRDYFNNSRRVEPGTGAKRKLAGYWMVITQFLAQMLAWLA